MAKVISEVGRKLVVECFSKQSLATHVGASLTKIDYGHVEVHFPSHPIATQHHGYFHGGIVSYLADISGGLAGFSCFDNPLFSSLTIELKINFLKAAQGKYLLGRGTLIQETGSLLVCKAEIFNPHDEIVAVMLQTNKKLRPREKKQ